MLSRLKKTKQDGFTIIEVLIVLAIAGLILLIVFLAVPALQRSARNTSRKSDEAGVLAAVSEYSDNNAGQLPGYASFAAPTITLCNVANCPAAGITDARSNAKLGYYTGTATTPTVGDVTIYKTYTAPPTTAADEMIIEEGATCSSATTAAAGSSRATAAVFGIEANGGFVWQCTGS